jgi:hypothetical protein
VGLQRTSHFQHQRFWLVDWNRGGLLRCPACGHALLDFTGRGDVVLDQFAGSGILAAEKVGRIAFGIEYEPQTRSNSSDAPQHRRLRPAAAQSHPESATDPKAATAFGGEGARGGQIAADPESGHA